MKNDLYSKVSRFVAWLLIPAALILSASVFAATRPDPIPTVEGLKPAPVHVQASEVRITAEEAITEDSPSPSVRVVWVQGREVPTVNVEALPRSKAAPKAAKPSKYRDPLIDPSAICTHEDLMQGGPGQVRYCHW
jgi:hypothetical protein